MPGNSSRPIILAIMGVALAITGGAKADFTDTFTNGPSPLWDNAAGSWTTSAGVYFATAPGALPDTYTGLPFVLTNFTVDVDINNVKDGGIWLHSTNNQNGILLVTGGGSTDDTGLSFDVFQNGVLISQGLDAVSGLFQQGADIHLHVVVEGDTYSVFLDSSLTAATTLTDSIFSSGRVGLYSNSSQTFDNVDIPGIVPEPSSMLLLGLGLTGMLYAMPRRRTTKNA